MIKKLTAIRMILFGSGFWLAVKSPKGKVKRLFSDVNFNDALLIAEDITNVLNDEYECSSAVNEAVKIANNL